MVVYISDKKKLKYCKMFHNQMFEIQVMLSLSATNAVINCHRKRDIFFVHVLSEQRIYPSFG